MIAHREKLLLRLCPVLFFLFLMLASAFLFYPSPVAADANPSAPLVEVLHLDQEVDPIIANYIDEGIGDAARRNASLVLITMDTPGGLSDSMKLIIQHILDSPVPIVVFVSPTGARGASAGFFILLSADIAAMAPATHTGASTPIFLPSTFTLPIDEVLRKKINNDAMAFLRSFTEKRGRNPKLAETAVTDARAFTEKEALENHLIDLVSANTDELLSQLNGREIARFDGRKTKLALTGYTVRQFELSPKQKFLARIVQPDIFFLLMMVGILGLYAEFTHPGVVAPGVVGGICAILALYAMHLLPVNFAGVLLILMAFALFILEAKLSSHGILLIGGIVAMFLGAMFLIRSPLTPAGVSMGVALSVTLPFAFLTVLLMRLVLKSRSWRVATGKEELIGGEGTVTTELPAGGEGMIRIHGELWRAVSPVSVAAGLPVRVKRVEGLTLFVEPLDVAAGS